MVANAAGWGLLDPQDPTFTDVPLGSTFYTYIETAYARGVVGAIRAAPRVNDAIAPIVPISGPATTSPVAN